jgi:hypothetical protein
LKHGNNRIVLLCFEDVRKPGESCHRQNFATYWQQMTGNVVPELEHRRKPITGNIAPELEHRGATEMAGRTNQADSASKTKLAARIGAWAERNGHALAYPPKSVQVRVDGSDVLLSLFPTWDKVYFEVGELRGRGMETEAEAILGRLQLVSSRRVTDEQAGVLTADLLAQWEPLKVRSCRNWWRPTGRRVAHRCTRWARVIWRKPANQTEGVLMTGLVLDLALRRSR